MLKLPGTYTVKVTQYYSKGLNILINNLHLYLFLYIIQIIPLIVLIALIIKQGIIGVIIGIIISIIWIFLMIKPSFILSLDLVKGNQIKISQVSKVILKIATENLFSISVRQLLEIIFLTIGYSLLLLGGIYLHTAYYFSLPLTVIYKLDPWDALETSRKFITKEWFSFFGLFILVNLPISLGILLWIIFDHYWTLFYYNFNDLSWLTIDDSMTNYFWLDLFPIILAFVIIQFGIFFKLCVLAVAFDDIVVKNNT